LGRRGRLEPVGILFAFAVGLALMGAFGGQGDALSASPTPSSPLPTPLPSLQEGLRPLPPDTPQLQALREAAFLLGEGDRLSAAGQQEEARERWREAAEAYRRAEEPLGEAEAYLRLADSYVQAGLLNPQNQQRAFDSYFQALLAASQVYETLIQERFPYDQETLAQAEARYDEGVTLIQQGLCAQAIPLLDEARRLYAQADFGAGEVRALAFKARCLAAQDDPLSALNALTTMLEAVPIVQSLPLGTSTDETYLEGQDRLAQGDLDGARAAFEKALAGYQEAGEPDNVAQVTLDLASVYALQGDYPQAERLYRQALAAFAAQGDRRNEATAWHNLGNLTVITGRYEEAVTAYRTALQTWQRLGDPANEVASLSGLGLALHGQGEYAAALNVLERALALQQRLSPNPEIEGDLLNNLGRVHYSQGDYRQALERFRQALALRRELPYRLKEAETLSNIAAVHASLGRFEEALTEYQQAVALEAELGLPLLEAKTRLNIAAVQIQRGEYQAGIATYLQALPTFVEQGERPTEAAIHLNVGSAYILLGDRDAARAHLAQALDLFAAIGNPEGEATVHTNLGLLALQEGDLDGAEHHLQQALTLWRDLGNATAAGRVLGNLALLALGRGNLQAALDNAKAALSQSETTGNQADQGRLLITIGLIRLAQDDASAALDAGGRALALAAQVGDPLATIGGHVVLALAYTLQGERPRAYEQVQEAIARLEALHGTITVAELKTAFLGNLADLYGLAVFLATEMGQPEAAFRYAEQARARAFLDQLANRRLGFRRALDPALAEEESRLRLALRALEQQLAQERARPVNRRREAAIEQLTLELDRRRQEYARILAELRLQSPRYAAMVSGEVLPLAQIQALLDDRTTLVAYFLTAPTISLLLHPDRGSPSGAGEEGYGCDGGCAYAFVIRHDRFTQVRLPLSTREIVNLVYHVRDQMGPQPLADPTAALVQLYQGLIAPLLPELPPGRLGIIPHGSLFYLPFAALTDGERWLDETYTLFYLPSASLLPYLADGFSDSSDASPLILAYPAPPGQPRLRYVEAEARTVARLYGVSPYLGPEAQERRVKTDAPQTSLLHIAAHGTLDPRAPLFSALLLAGDEEEDGRLEAGEVYDLDLSAARLVVLSACQTQGGEGVAGDEVMALHRAFLYAGAPAVVATLWNVDDRATEELMETFYEHLRRGAPADEALRRAQQAVRQRYPSPYYWAAFTLTGDPSITLPGPGTSPPTSLPQAPCSLGLGLLVAGGIGGLRLRRRRRQ